MLRVKGRKKQTGREGDMGVKNVLRFRFSEVICSLGSYAVLSAEMPEG